MSNLWVKVADGQSYYHGTSHVFTPGDEIVPGAEIGKRNFGDARGATNEHVFVTASPFSAFDWGVQGVGERNKSKVRVYEVKPHTEPVPGPNANHGLRTNRATVIRELWTTDHE